VHVNLPTHPLVASPASDADRPNDLVPDSQTMAPS